MSTISSAAPGYSLASMLQQMTGYSPGAISGTSSSSTQSGALSLIQGTSSTFSGIFGAIYGSGNTTTSNAFSALGGDGSAQTLLNEIKAIKPYNPSLGNKLNITA